MRIVILILGGPVIIIGAVVLIPVPDTVLLRLVQMFCLTLRVVVLVIYIIALIVDTLLGGQF